MTEKNFRLKSGECAGQKTGASHLSPIQHNFQTVTEAFHEGNVVEHHKVETSCEDMY